MWFLRKKNSKKKVLFIGGCHAKVLSRLFSNSVITSEIINYVEIGAHRPPDYKFINSHDIVVMSPVRANNAWSSKKLLSEIRGAGKQAFIYPWLQWNGYFPHAQKGTLLGTTNWTGVTDSNYHEYLNRDIDNITKKIIEENFYSSINICRDNEIDAKTDFSVVDFILDNYRNERLFITPDHPSNLFYAFVVNEISALIGAEVDFDPKSYSQLHPELRVPISPSVISTLRLNFDGGDYFNTEAVPLPVPSFAVACIANPDNLGSLFVQIQKNTLLLKYPDFSIDSPLNVSVKAGDWIIGQELGKDDDYTCINIKISSLTSAIGYSYYLQNSDIYFRNCGYKHTL